MAETDLVESLPYLFESPALGRLRIADRPAKGAGGNIWPLRQHEKPAAGAKTDAAAAPWPQARDCPNKRAFAGSGLPCDEHSFSPPDLHICLFDDGRTVAERHRNILEAEHRFAFRFTTDDPAKLIALFGPLETVKRHHQGSNAACAGIPIRQPGIVVDQPAEGGLNDGESGCRLHDLAEGHAAVEKFGRAEKKRNNGRNQHRSMRHDSGAHILLRHLLPLLPDIAESFVEVASLLLFAAKQGDAFPVFPDAGQRVAEFRLQLVLDLGDPDEVPADQRDGT
ncbi:hypothetical protein D3C80_1165010 [compost metagenome]